MHRWDAQADASSPEPLDAELCWRRTGSTSTWTSWISRSESSPLKTRWIASAPCHRWGMAPVVIARWTEGHPDAPRSGRRSPGTDIRRCFVAREPPLRKLAGT